MPEATLRLGDNTAVTSSVTTIEFGLVAVAVLLLVALLLVKAKRERDQKIRKAASMGYYDPDAARYGHGSVALSPIEVPFDPVDLPLAPSFVAPVRNGGAKRRTGGMGPPSPGPLPSPFGMVMAVPPRAVPAFDPVEAIMARPAGAGPSTAPLTAQLAPAPPAPGPPMTPPAAPVPPLAPASLPRLDLPPPPG